MRNLFLLFIMVVGAVSSAQNIREDLTPMAITWTDEHGDRYSFIPGLTNDLLQEFAIHDSRGPGWKDEAMEILWDRYDFHENSSYWHERGGSESCEWGDVNWNDVEEYYGFRWKAIKRTQGSRRSVMYIVEYFTELTGPGSFRCEIPEKELLFLNKLENGKPIFLGEREFSIPQDVRN